MEDLEATLELDPEGLQHEDESVAEDGGRRGEVLVEVEPRELVEEHDVWDPHVPLLEVQAPDVAVRRGVPLDELVHPAQHKLLLDSLHFRRFSEIYVVRKYVQYVISDARLPL